MQDDRTKGAGAVIGQLKDNPAMYAEAFPHAWGIPRISVAFRQAAEEDRPVVILLRHEFTA